MDTYLTTPRLKELFNALIGAGLAHPAPLDALLSNISPEFATSLSEDPEGNVRLLHTLAALNQMERRPDGSVPFVTWLRNAVMLTAGRPQANVIKRTLVEVNARANGVAPVQDPTASAGDESPGEREKIVQSDDLLPYSFLAAGVTVGRSVARLQVDRIVGGEPALLPDGAPTRYFGTGWLLTGSLLITNHHVVNARNDGEPRASAADLDLQAKSLVAQFDFDAEGVAPVEERVEALVASSPLDGALDYAILRLGRDVGRAPLRLAPAPVALLPGAAAGGYPAVNIIQHPEGRPKMVACRNNLVTRTSDTEIWYFTDTMSGSSGAPVLDDRWRVVALHKRWGFAEHVTYQGKESAWANVGTQITAILRDLEASGQTSLLAEIRAAG